MAGLCYDKFLSTGEFFPNTQFMCCIFLFGHANSSIKHPVMGGELVDSWLWEGTAIAVPWELEVMVDGVVDRLELCSFYYLGMVWVARRLPSRGVLTLGVLLAFPDYYGNGAIDVTR